jgi:hypothetical protein
MIPDRAWLACCHNMQVRELLQLRATSKFMNEIVKIALPKKLRIRIPNFALAAHVDNFIEIYYQLQKLADTFNRPFILIHAMYLSQDGDFFRSSWDSWPNYQSSNLGFLNFITTRISRIEIDLKIIYMSHFTKKLLTIEDAFAGSEKCTSLYLRSYQPLSQENIVKILGYPLNLTKLVLLYKNSSDCKKVETPLSRMVNLTSLELQLPFVPNIKDLLSAIRTTKLTELTLKYNNFDNTTELIPVLEKNLGITTLDLSNNRLTDIGPIMPFLARMHKLIQFDLIHNKGMDVPKTTKQIKEVLPWLASIEDWEDNTLEWSTPPPLGSFECSSSPDTI